MGEMILRDEFHVYGAAGNAGPKASGQWLPRRNAQWQTEQCLINSRPAKNPWLNNRNNPWGFSFLFPLSASTPSLKTVREPTESRDRAGEQCWK